MIYRKKDAKWKSERDNIIKGLIKDYKEGRESRLDKDVIKMYNLH